MPLQIDSDGSLGLTLETATVRVIETAGEKPLASMTIPAGAAVGVNAANWRAFAGYVADDSTAADDPADLRMPLRPPGEATDVLVRALRAGEPSVRSFGWQEFTGAAGVSLQLAVGESLKVRYLQDLSERYDRFQISEVVEGPLAEPVEITVLAVGVSGSVEHVRPNVASVSYVPAARTLVFTGVDATGAPFAPLVVELDVDQSSGAVAAAMAKLAQDAPAAFSWDGQRLVYASPSPAEGSITLAMLVQAIQDRLMTPAERAALADLDGTGTRALGDAAIAQNNGVPWHASGIQLPAAAFKLAFDGAAAVSVDALLALPNGAVGTPAAPAQRLAVASSQHDGDSIYLGHNGRRLLVSWENVTPTTVRRFVATIRRLEPFADRATPDATISGARLDASQRLPAPDAGKLLAWNGDGTSVENVPGRVPAAATEAEAEAGTEEDLRSWSALRVAQTALARIGAAFRVGALVGATVAKIQRLLDAVRGGSRQDVAGLAAVTPFVGTTVKTQAQGPYTPAEIVAVPYAVYAEDGFLQEDVRVAVRVPKGYGDHPLSRLSIRVGDRDAVVRLSVYYPLTAPAVTSDGTWDYYEVDHVRLPAGDARQVNVNTPAELDTNHLALAEGSVTGREIADNTVTLGNLAPGVLPKVATAEEAAAGVVTDLRQFSPALVHEAANGAAAARVPSGNAFPPNPRDEERFELLAAVDRAYPALLTSEASADGHALGWWNGQFGHLDLPAPGIDAIAWYDGDASNPADLRQRLVVVKSSGNAAAVQTVELQGVAVPLAVRNAGSHFYRSVAQVPANPLPAGQARRAQVVYAGGAKEFPDRRYQPHEYAYVAAEQRWYRDSNLSGADVRDLLQQLRGDARLSADFIRDFPARSFTRTLRSGPATGVSVQNIAAVAATVAQLVEPAFDLDDVDRGEIAIGWTIAIGTRSDPTITLGEDGADSVAGAAIQFASQLKALAAFDAADRAGTTLTAGTVPVRKGATRVGTLRLRTGHNAEGQLLFQLDYADEQGVAEVGNFTAALYVGLQWSPSDTADAPTGLRYGDKAIALAPAAGAGVGAHTNRRIVAPDAAVVVLSDWGPLTLVADADAVGGVSATAAAIAFATAGHVWINGSIELDPSHGGGAARLYAEFRGALTRGAATTRPAALRGPTAYAKTAASSANLAQGPDRAHAGFQWLLAAEAGDSLAIEWRAFLQTNDQVDIVAADSAITVRIAS